ncbi:MAG: cyclic nucleotide-binding domain-containing protein [Deltaproteobacteria bacterium]|nr:cyclic nucleotide-binding domain-containing protein [Deltaproteobacteria bacterium]
MRRRRRAFLEGTEFDGLWVILEGEVRVERETTHPGMSTKALLHPGDIVGSLAGSAESETTLSAMSLTPVSAALLPQRELRLLAREDERFQHFEDILEADGLLLSDLVYAGNGRIPGALSALWKVFSDGA